MHRALITAVATACLTGGAAAQQLIEIPGDQPWAWDVTSDGEVVVGTEASGGFVWRWRVDATPTLIGGTEARAVSDDGTVVVGCFPHPDTGEEVAGRWTAATGWVALGALPGAVGCPSLSNALDVSADGSTVVGLSWDACEARGFVWFEGLGMRQLSLQGHGSNRAHAIAGDGSRIGGFALGSGAFFTPVLWQPDLSGQLLDIDAVGEITGFNDDGSIGLGTADQSAFWFDTATLTETHIGSLNLGWQGRPTAISDAADQIAGYDVLGPARVAWIWTPSGGMVSLQSHLTALGVPGVPPLQVVNAASDDGTVLVGGRDGLIDPKGFIAITGEPTWQDMGHGLAGVGGAPALGGTGTLIGGAPAHLGLADAAPSASSWLVTGLAPLWAPLKGGTLIPSPDLLSVLPTSAAGSWSLPFAWPVGLPPGTPIWWQAWVVDASGPSGLSASNGLLAITP